MNSNTDYNMPRVQLSCSLCTYKTFSQDILDDHMDSQHRGLLNNLLSFGNVSYFPIDYIEINSEKLSLKLIDLQILDERNFQCNECGLMYATRGDLRQHVTKVHRCGIYAKMPAGGLSIRQRSSSSTVKNSQRSSNTSTSPLKQTNRRRETVFCCSFCQSKFPHTRAIERHLYDAHHIDPFDTEAMKNATICDEQEVEENHEEETQSALTLNSSQHQQENVHRRDEDEQMAIIQFRNQHQNADQSRLIVKIERGIFLC